MNDVLLGLAVYFAISGAFIALFFYAVKRHSMTLPNHQRCREVLDALRDEPSLTKWERDFVQGNEDRVVFSDRQKEIVAELLEKYEC